MGRSGSKMKVVPRGGGLAALTLAMVAAAAAGEARSAEDCTTIVDRDERLACYDRLHGRSVPTPAASEPAETRPALPPATATAAPAPVPVPVPARAEPPTPSGGKDVTEPVATTQTDDPSGEPAGKTGTEIRPEPAPELGAEQLPKSREARLAEQRPDDTVSTVTAIGERNTRKYWFRLENGQLWEQVSIEATNIREGDAVHISRGMFGSYSMRRADGSSRSTRVQRRE